MLDIIIGLGARKDEEGKQALADAIKNEIDVREIPPRERHPRIFNTFDGLSAGETMMIVNDHDPMPLYYQFMHERPNAFEWEYIERGPEIWRVAITRTN